MEKLLEIVAELGIASYGDTDCLVAVDPENVPINFPPSGAELLVRMMIENVKIESIESLSRKFPPHPRP